MSQLSLNHQKAMMRSVFKKLASSPKIIGAVLILSPLHTLAPHVYNWYLGKLADCNGSNCHIILDLEFFSLEIPGTLTILSIFTFWCLASRALFWALFEIKASDLMHGFFEQVIDRLQHVRATWFDEHPSGKLLNQLFGDYSNLQRRFVFSLSDGQVCYLELISCFIMVAWINPLLAIPIIALWVLILFCQIKVNRAFDHVSSVASKKKGQMIEVLSDVIEGGGVYRSYQSEDHILNRMQHRVSAWIKVEFFQWRLMTWSWTWMWLLAEVAIAVVLTIAAWAFQQGHIEAAVAGMILVAAGQQQTIIGWTLDNIGAYLTGRAKALRFLSLAQLPQEQDEEQRDNSRFHNVSREFIPSEGTIEFKNFTASYRKDSAVVLSELNLKIPQGTKIALIGRTGSGKSTIIQALFRMLYVHAGDITVDDCSLYDYPAEKTRSIFGIVPQNPWLFAGTLRENIDIKGEFGDDKINGLLCELELDYFNLKDEVQEGGLNYSVGERQMICLARCLLSDQRIIVMDEPTSNIDLETDAKVQRMIRTKLIDRTLIVIAHRKETVADFEVIFSMDQHAKITKNQN